MRPYLVQRALAVALMLAGTTHSAIGSVVICDEASWLRYHYGQKAHAAIIVRQEDQDAFIRAIERYSSDAKLSYAEVDSENPYQNPPLKTRSPILQSASVDIGIEATVTNRTNVATFSISTFSYSCGPTEDWRPYWRGFVAFIGKWPAFAG